MDALGEASQQTAATQATQGASAVQAGSLNPAQLTGSLGKMRWLGPIMAIGGAALALYALSKGRVAPVGGLAEGMKAPINKFMLYGGVGTALSGLMTTAVGFKAFGMSQGHAAGIQTGRQQGIQELSAAVEQQMVPTLEQLSRENQQLKQALQAGGAGNVQPGQSQTGQVGGIDGSATTAGTTTTDPTGSGATTQQTSQTAAQVIPAAQWSPAAIIGQSITLGEARVSSGASVADAGTYVLTQSIGSSQGYTSLAEADSAARRAMTTELDGVKNYRWVVIEHGGAFHAFIAHKDQEGAPALPAANGNVAAWHALRAIEDGSLNVQWMTYDWSRDGANSVGVFQPGSAAASTGGGGPVGGTSAPADATVTTAASSVPRAATAARSLIGYGFQVNDADVNGARVRGGSLQLQQLVDTSVAGFDTPLEAADAARLQRQVDVSGNPWKRWVSVQLDDGKFYVYAASIVNQRVPDLAAGAAPLNIFGTNVAEYFDGQAWQAQSDV